MRRIFGFFIGIMAGSLIGGSVALLFAPSAGQDLRGQIRERATGFAGEIKGAAEARRIELEDRLIELRAPRQKTPAKDE